MRESRSTSELVALVVARLVGNNSLPTQVHGGEFVDERQVAELLEAMGALVGRFTSEASVPKELALATVAIATRFENVHYPQDQQERLEDIGAEVERLAEEIFTA
ncbi:hypothetical protein [Cellulomonas xiejunii]|uniref:hypothetical protein n=1 Tax=Cellulomonas xiejunii TaxID=2968083 RepID=UPI001D0F080C|nr:hypothetical protein [Cellulomonas xiejunii]MCC2313562.1 hypothetical protein [Cellulomonas xiejunii]